MRFGVSVSAGEPSQNRDRAEPRRAEPEESKQPAEEEEEDEEEESAQ